MNSPGVDPHEVGHQLDQRDFFTIGEWGKPVTVEDIHMALEWYQGHPEIKAALQSMNGTCFLNLNAMYQGQFGSWHMVWNNIYN